MIKISVSQQGTKKLGKFIQVLLRETKRNVQVLQNSTTEIAEAVGAYIFMQILEEHPLKEWMASRTDMEIIPKGASLTIKFSGKQLEDDKANLWAVHEYGAHIPAIKPGDLTKPIRFEKDDGSGQVVYTWQRKAYDITNYKGEVQSIVRGSILQAQNIAAGILGTKAAVLTAQAVNKASQGELRVSPGAKKILSKAGVNSSELAKLGVSESFVNPLTGGISLRSGSTGRFVSNPGSLKGIRLK